MRKQSAGDTIIFEIENIIEETNNGDINYYKVTNELNEFNRNGNGRTTKRIVQQLCSTDVTGKIRVSRKTRFLAKW